MQVLQDIGMTPTAALMRIPLPPKYLPVMLDGVVLGYLPSVTIPAVVTRLRDIKAARLAEEQPAPPDAETMRLTVSRSVSLLYISPNFSLLSMCSGRIPSASCYLDVNTAASQWLCFFICLPKHLLVENNKQALWCATGSTAPCLLARPPALLCAVDADVFCTHVLQ